MSAHHDLPAITVATCDYDRLLFSAGLARRCGHPSAEFLLAELQRATLCQPEELPEDVVSTNCRVIYRVDDDPKVRAHLLVHPDDLMWPGAEISVMSPLGAALLGLRVGDRMRYRGEGDDREHEVCVEGVGMRFLDSGLAWRDERAGPVRR